MSDMVTSTGVPEVALGSGQPSTQSVPPTFSGKWEDMAKDMAAIAAEQGQPAQPASSQPPAAVTPPEVQQPAAAPSDASQTQAPSAAAPAAQPPAPEVPEKFRTPDGKLDQDKLLKSFHEAERALGRKTNEVNQLRGSIQQPQAQQAAPTGQPAAPAPQAASAQFSQFELQVAQDLMNQAAALGQPMSQAHALATARIQVNLLEAKHRADTAATFSEVEQFRQTLQENARKAELEALAKNPQTAWLITPEGQQELIRARQEYPHLNQSNEPWRAAALHVLGQRALYGQMHQAASTGQVQTPNPAATQQQAPPLPAVAAPRSAAAPIVLNSPADVEAYVKTLTPEQEAKFWQMQGLKWEAPRKQYMGI